MQLHIVDTLHIIDTLHVKDTLRITQNSDTFVTLLGWSVKADTIFATLTSLLVFGSGIIIAKWLEALREKKRLRELESYFYTAIESLEEVIRVQTAAFIRASEQLREEKTQNISLTILPAFDVGNLMSFSPIDTYKIFVLKKKGPMGERVKLYQDIFSNLRYINVVKRTCEEHFRIWGKESKSLESRWDDNYQNDRHVFVRIIKDAAQKHDPKSPLFLRVSEILAKLQAHPEDRDIFHLHKYIVVEADKLDTENLKDPLLGGMFQMLDGCNRAFHMLKVVNEYYSVLFKQYSEMTGKAYQDIRNSLRRVRELRS